MPTKNNKRIVGSFLAAATMAISGIFFPAPALADPTCEYYVAQICRNWQAHGYASQQECYYYELGAAGCGNGLTGGAVPLKGLKPDIR